MPVFQYQVRDNRGRRQQGARSAADMGSLTSALREEGFFIVSIKEQQDKAENKKAFSFSVGSKQAKTRDMMVFCRQFSNMIKAGMTILNSLQVLQDQVEDKTMREKLTRVTTHLMQGNSLTDSFRDQGDYFPPIFINMVEAGEEGGILDETLYRLAGHFERQHNLEEKIKSATTYPLVISGVAVAVVIFLLVVVLPTFANIFDSLGADLPAITRILLAVSGFASKYWYLLLAAVFVFFLALRQYFKTPRGKEMIDGWRFKIPIYGPIYQKTVIARFSRTLGTLQTSGVEILKSLDLVGRVVDNVVVEKLLRDSRDMVRQGQRLADPLRDSKVFSPMSIAMITVGEETGALDEMLGKIADFYEAEVEYVVDRLSSILEPILLIFLGLVVGLIVISIITPMFNMYQYIG